jgi:PPOX class probable FMN-dependent enzyme
MGEITSIEQLRELYGEPSERTKNKVLSFLDCHAITFIEHSHFAILSTVDESGAIDLSPKGGAPGFIKVVDGNTLLIPDSSGNKRLDSLQNIITNAQVGLLFTVNGVDEIVRVKGTASIHHDDAFAAICPDGNKAPKTVIKVVVESMLFHCAKAIMRGKLWDTSYRVDRSLLPSIAEILKDQQNLDGKFVSQDEMVRYYESSLK